MTSTRRIGCGLCAVAAWTACVAAYAEPSAPQPPRALDPRVKIELTAAEPDIVTPTGIAVDQNGDVLVVESHTHFRPSEYQGPKTDRIRRLVGRRTDGRAARVEDYHVGGAATMNLAIHPDGTLWVAMRSEIYRLPKPATGESATPNAGPFDRSDAGATSAPPQALVRLVTDGNYPHNGLSGFAFDAQGRAYFGLGENLGAPYRLVAADGSEFAGGGEGGRVFSCNRDGGDLRPVASGFWNPFHLCFDRGGNLFAVDNDPDSRPPCRLLHVVDGGDYGYRFRNGRKGLHPFTAWNGELPGTLPMAAGTGEAPSGMVWYDRTALPTEFQQTLLVTSWGDHAIERYRLQPHGASFRAVREVVISGDEDFRPVGITIAPDGSLYISDWVDKSYAVHGKGRVWRIFSQDTLAAVDAPLQSAAPRTAALQPSLDELWNQASHDDPFVAHAARRALLARSAPDVLDRFEAPATRLAALLLCRGLHPHGAPEVATPVLASALTDGDPNVRLVAVQWIGEAVLTTFRPQIERGLTTPGTTRALFAAHLAALELLDGRKPYDFDQHGHDVYLARMALTERADAELRKRLLRMIDPACSELATATLVEWQRAGPDGLRLEIVRTLSARNEPQGRALVQQTARDDTAASELRLAAIAGLSPVDADERQELLDLARHAAAPIRREALRALQGAEINDLEARELSDAATDDESQELLRRSLGKNLARPLPLASDELASTALALVDEPADPAAGERLFFHPRGPGCYKCHEVDGRGGAVGPELTEVGRALDPARLVQSLVTPGREIAPRYAAWTLALADGRTLTGLLVGETASGQQYADAEGRIWDLQPEEIQARQPSRESIMPAHLVHRLTRQELADLLAFLRGRK